MGSTDIDSISRRYEKNLVVESRGFVSFCTPCGSILDNGYCLLLLLTDIATIVSCVCDMYGFRSMAEQMNL